MTNTLLMADLMTLDAAGLMLLERNQQSPEDDRPMRPISRAYDPDADNDDVEEDE